MSNVFQNPRAVVKVAAPILESAIKVAEVEYATEGGYGIIALAHDLTTDKPIVVKFIVDDKNAQDEIKRMSLVMGVITSNNIKSPRGIGIVASEWTFNMSVSTEDVGGFVKDSLDSQERVDLLVFGMERMEKTLSDAVKTGASDATVAKWMCDVHRGVWYLHHYLKLVHSDLRQVNVLIGRNGHAFIADLGCSRTFDQKIRCGIPGTTFKDFGDPAEPAADIFAFFNLVKWCKKKLSDEGRPAPLLEHIHRITSDGLEGHMKNPKSWYAIRFSICKPSLKRKLSH